ncbi:hypothetical protein [Peribacillus sp. NPDC096540]|uniref:hypothetical protein n=1 Tax=Peribacillus sp. NPDC096540 TaxID=3390612 RepID=UPI003D0629A4
MAYQEMKVTTSGKSITQFRKKRLIAQSNSKTAYQLHKHHEIPSEKQSTNWCY